MTAIANAASHITTVTRPQALTIGVEEEFLLLDPATGHNMPVAAHLRTGLPQHLRAQNHTEFRTSMTEMVTPVCTDLHQLGNHLRDMRRAAAAAGARLVAIGATPLAGPDPAVSPDQRYQEMTRRYGAITRDPVVCGCHVHVGVPDRATAIQVCNHLRVWLPVIQALAANSPLHQGIDTGHASWRSVQLTRWPSLGPTPELYSVEDYDRIVAAMIDSGVILDETMVYWYSRPSVRYPTVEIRVADVCPTVEDTVLIACLVRGLVGTALENIEAGLPAPQIRDCLVTAAHWRAAHDGMDDKLIDLRIGRPRPAWELANEMFATISPTLLRHGDLQTAVTAMARLRRRGNGATRQRRIHQRTGDIHTVLTALGKQTASR